MRDSLAFLLTFVALVQLVFGLTPMLLPPDPFAQVRMWIGGTVAATVVAFWFVRTGADRFDVTVGDVWLFVVGTVVVLFVGQVFVVGLARSQVEDVLLTAAALLIGGWLAFGVGADGLREAVGQSE